MRGNLSRAALTATLLVAGQVLVAGTAAHADPASGAVHRSGAVVYFAAGPGATNDVELFYLGGATPRYLVNDAAVALLAGLGCVQDSDHWVSCDATGVTGFVATLGDLDDALGVRGTIDTTTVYGGPGNDTVEGLDSADTFYGEDGNDTLLGSAGNDVLFGGSGMDTLVGGPGADTVSYADQTGTGGVQVDPDGATQDDGAPGEGDTVMADVENLIGSPGNDILSGNAAANLLAGGPGHDAIYGGSGGDRLYGGDGFDTLDGDNLRLRSSTAASSLDIDLCSVGPGGGVTTGCEKTG